MAIRTIPEQKFYICDRCGFEHENNLARNSNATLTVDVTARMLGGDIGGGRSSRWLCGTCENDLRKFLAGEAVEALAQPE